MARSQRATPLDKTAPGAMIAVAALVIFDGALGFAIADRLGGDLASKTSPIETAALLSTDSTSALEPLTVPRSDTGQSLARPLFLESRRPFAPPPPPPPPAPTPPPAQADIRLFLDGAFVEGPVRKALLRAEREQHGVWLRQGEEFAGWLVQSIDQESVTLARKDETRVLRIYPPSLALSRSHAP